MSNNTNRRNGNNGRGQERDAPGTSRPMVCSVQVVQPPSDDGWGEPDPTYWEKKERKEEARRRELHYLYGPRNGQQNNNRSPRSQNVVAQGALPVERRNDRGPARRVTSSATDSAFRRPQQQRQHGGIIAQGAFEEIVPQADFDYSTYGNHGLSRGFRGGFSSQLEPQSGSVTEHINALSLLDSDDSFDSSANCSKDSGVVEMDDGFRSPRRPMEVVTTVHRKEPELDERTETSILKVYSNDLLMETIISNITKLSDRSQVEMASSRMFTLSKQAPYRFSEGGDHLHIHFTTFDDFATIQYGSVVRTVPILTLNTRRFDKMESKMTIALHRILQHIGARFARKVRKITLGGTTDFYSARGVPDHHLILTYDLLSYLLKTFTSVTALHLVNCGIDDGALDICDTALWHEAMARMESVELRTVWADTPSRLPELLIAPACNLEQFTLTRFKCKRMGAALLDHLRRSNARLKEVQLVLDEDTADDDFEMFGLLKEVASRTESLRITVAEIGDGSQLSPKCFAILPRLRDIPNLTELKLYVQPKNTGQFAAVVTLFRDLELLTALRTLHVEGFVDGNWLAVEAVYNLAEAFRTGMTYRAETLEDVSFANFPRPTKHNAHGFKGDRKEGAYECLWEAMASSIGRGQRIRRLALTSMRLEDAHLRKMYNAISKTAEEVYLKNIRRVTSRSVVPFVNGEFPLLKKLEAEIAIEPLVLHNLADAKKTPSLQYAKFALKQRISDEDYHTKMLRAMFSAVFLDQESPRGPLHQFVEVRNRIPDAKAPVATAADARPQQQSGRPVRPFDYRTAGYGHQRTRRPPAKKLYGEWDD